MSINFQPGVNIEAHLRQKTDEMQKCGLQLQPHIIVIAEDTLQLSRSVVYVVVQGTTYYKVDSILGAVDLVIKACFLFGLEYPQIARSTWTFIQKALYKIVSPFDILSARVLELLTDLAD
jgi:hypothetical protein